MKNIYFPVIRVGDFWTPMLSPQGSMGYGLETMESIPKSEEYQLWPEKGIGVGVVPEKSLKDWIKIINSDDMYGIDVARLDDEDDVMQYLFSKAKEIFHFTEDQKPFLMGMTKEGALCKVDSKGNTVSWDRATKEHPVVAADFVLEGFYPRKG